MSKNTKRSGGIGLGLLEDFELKKLEIEQRLARTFLAFVRTTDSGYFVTGGKEPPSLFGNENFRCVFIGNSLSDLAHGEDLLRDVSSSISTAFSPRDVHSTVILDFLSKYLRLDLEDMRIPTGFAVEFAIFDSKCSFMRVNFSGEIEIDDLEESEKDVLIMGAYDEKFKKSLLAYLARAPKVIDERTMEKLALNLKKKYKLEHVGIIS